MNKIRRQKMVRDIEEIKKYLPHRYPFLLIDRIIDQKPGSCKAVKCITFNEEYFVGHFPQISIVPGCIILEAMAQSTAFIGRSSTESSSFSKTELKSPAQMTGFLISANIRFKQPVIPGDQLIINTELTKQLGKIKFFICRAYVDNEITAEAELKILDNPA
jgi:3-hydroxyacyl-[acyl-carrier-protein] dehydratase